MQAVVWPNILATMIGLSLATLGRPPMQHVIFIRMKKASQLVSETDESIAEIAERVGYSTANAFSETFLRCTASRPFLSRRSRHRSSSTLLRRWFYILDNERYPVGYSRRQRIERSGRRLFRRNRISPPIPLMRVFLANSLTKKRGLFR